MRSGLRCNPVSWRLRIRVTRVSGEASERSVSRSGVRLTANPPDRTRRAHPAEHETECADEGADDLAATGLTALTDGFLTGTSIPVDGGEYV
jgi:hypothetical protein